MANDLAALQGRWKVADLEVGGTKMPVSMFPDAEVSVDGDTFTSTGMGSVYSGKLTLFEQSDAKTFSLAFTQGPEAGNANHALYELSGNTWRLCLDMKGGPAPQTFATTAANGYALETLTRIG
jgi:uncharacterized protein (TIGR03067 family)